MRHPPHLLWATGIGAVAVAIILLGGLAVGRWPVAFDRWALLSLRTPGDLSRPIGPAWLRDAALDVTALGGGTVLTMVVAGAVVLMLARALWLTAALVVVATLSGSTAVALFKSQIARPRPALVDRLVNVSDLSFPSGHAANSAIVYLTLAFLATQVARGRATRNAIILLAVLLVGMIGCTRLYLGVHWPSDVLAGWSFGTLWALAWWLAAAQLRGR